MVWDQCFLHYPGKGTSGCTAEPKGVTGKYSQNGLGPMLFAQSWERHLRLHCGTERKNWEVLPEWCGTNAFCTILGKVLPVALRHLQSHPEPESAPRMTWDQCFLHYPAKGTSGCTAEFGGGTPKCSRNGVGLMLFARSWKGHFRLHCGTDRRNREVLPERSGTNAFPTILGRALLAAPRS